MNEALENVSDLSKKSAVVTPLNILRIGERITKKTTVEIWPDITDEKVIYKDADKNVFFIDGIEVVAPGSGKSGSNTLLYVSLNSVENRRFTKFPLSTSATGVGETELHNSIFCTEIDEDGRRIGLGFQFPEPTTNEFRSSIFKELYLITCEGDNDKATRYHRVDPTVIIIRG